MIRSLSASNSGSSTSSTVLSTSIISRSCDSRSVTVSSRPCSAAYASVSARTRRLGDQAPEPGEVLLGQSTDQVGLGGVAAVDGGLADPGPGGDLGDGRVQPVLGEDLGRRGQHPLVVAPGVRAPAGPVVVVRSRLGHGLIVRQTSLSRKWTRSVRMRLSWTYPDHRVRLPGVHLLEALDGVAALPARPVVVPVTASWWPASGCSCSSPWAPARPRWPARPTTTSSCPASSRPRPST